MNIQSFYEYVILRDVFGYLLPGGISLIGFIMVIQSVIGDDWIKFLPTSSTTNSWLGDIVFILFAFLAYLSFIRHKI